MFKRLHNLAVANGLEERRILIIMFMDMTIWESIMPSDSTLKM